MRTAVGEIGKKEYANTACIQTDRNVRQLREIEVLESLDKTGEESLIRLSKGEREKKSRQE